MMDSLARTHPQEGAGVQRDHRREEHVILAEIPGKQNIVVIVLLPGQVTASNRDHEVKPDDVQRMNLANAIRRDTAWDDMTSHAKD